MILIEFAYNVPIAVTREQMGKDSNILRQLVAQTNIIVDHLERIEDGQERLWEGNTKILQAIQEIIEREGIGH